MMSDKDRDEDKLKDSSNGISRVKNANQFKLHVSKIPSTLSRDEFKKIFADVAMPCYVYLAENTVSRFKWGFVAYTSLDDAEAVIRKINGESPYELQIKYANGTNSNGEHKFKKTNNRDHMRNNYHQTNNSGYIGNTRMPEDSSSSDINDTCDSHPHRRDMHQRKFSNRLTIKNIQIVAENGHRAVTAQYEPISLASNNNDLVNFTSHLVALDSCYFCKSDAHKKCPYCNRPYCSDICAAKDLENHKSHCSRMNGFRATSTPRDKNEEVASRRRREGPSHSNFKHKSNSRPASKSGESDNSSSDTRTYKIDYNKETLIPPLKPNQQVLVMYKDENEYLWVVSDKEAAFSLHTQLQEFCSRPEAKSVNQPIIGRRCAAFSQDENEWYRAEIISIKPRLRVRYMDYGNEEDISTNQLKYLSSHLSSIPNLAFKIKLSSESSHLMKQIDVTTVLSLNSLEVINNTLLVDARIIPHGTSSQLSHEQTHHIHIPPIPKDQFSQVVISFSAESNVYWVQKSNDCKPCLQLLKDIDSYCRQAVPVTSSELKLGMICGALFEDLWYRAEIVSLPTAAGVKVRLIDYGNEDVISMRDIRKLTHRFISTPPYAFKIELAYGTSSKYVRLAEDKNISVKPVSKNGDSWIVHVENEVYNEPFSQSKGFADKSNTIAKSSEPIEAIAQPVSELVTSKSATMSYSKSKQPPIPAHKFSRVVVSVPVDSTSYWVFKFEDAPTVETISHDLKNYCESENAKKFSDRPDIGTLCSAMFEGDWFRGEIISIKPDIIVKFLDYGNEEACSLNYLKDLPAKWASLPPFAFQIKLAEKTPNKYHNLAYSSVLSAMPMDQVDGVWSVQVENEIYDDAIVDYRLSDDSKSPSSLATCRSADVLTQQLNSPIPLNHFTPVIISYAVDDSIYWVNKMSDLNQVFQVQNILNEYCNSCEAKVMTDAAVGTLCSALYEAEWYRASILAVKPALMVRFIDYGNEEICDMSDVRTLPQQLSTIPPLTFQIKLAADTCKKYHNLANNSELSVKPICLVEDMWLVHIENEKDSESKNSSVSNGKETNDFNSKVSNDISSLDTNEILHTSKENNAPQTFSKKTSLDKLEPPISREVFTQVVVMVPVNDTCYWVVPQDKMSLNTEIIQDLTSNILEPIDDIKSGLKCAALYDDQWSRAKIVCVNPLQVKYVDFGNVEDIEPLNIRALPTELAKIKPLAFMIKLSEDISDKYRGLEMGSKLSIKPESKDTDNSWFVSVPESESERSNGSEDMKERHFEDHKISFRMKSVYDEDESQPSIKPKVKTSCGKEEFDESFHLPFNIFSKVNITVCNSKDDYWVYLNSSLDMLVEMTTKLGVLSEEKVIPIMGKTYVKLYEDSWCRGKVISMNPLKIFFIDYGNEEIVKSSELHPLPPQFLNTPPFAFRIKLAEGTNDKYHNINDIETVLGVKPVSKSAKGYYIVHIEDEKYGTGLASPTSPNITHSETQSKLYCNTLSEEICFDHLLKEAVRVKNCDIKVNKIVSNIEVCCSIIIHGEYSNHLDHIHESIASLHLSPHYSTRVGSMIGCMNECGRYCRGVLMSTFGHEHRVSLLDHGYTIQTTSLCPLPILLENLPFAAVSCKFATPQSGIEVGSLLRCLQIEMRGDVVECEVFGRGRCSLHERTDVNDVDSSSHASISIPSNSPVVISAVTDVCGTVYIQSLIQSNIQALGQIISQTAAHARNEKCAPQEVEVGDVVACLFHEDNNYYRAQILNINKQENIAKYSVHFLDYGNNCEVCLKDIRFLPDSIKNVASYSVKVCLEGVSNGVMIPQAQALLDEHINNQTCFNILYERLDCVKLELLGVGLSSNLNKIMNSTPRISSKDNKRIMLNEVKFTDWLAGAKLDLLILCLISHNEAIVLHNKDAHLNAIKDEFTEKLTHYATKKFSSHFTYRPFLNEVIIARYQDGLWYRAYCTNILSTGCYEIMFLDFGNMAEISETDSRPITLDFLQVPVVPKKCKIYGVPDEVSIDISRQLESLFSEGSLHEVLVTKDSSQGTAVVYHPLLVSKVKDNIIPLPTINFPNNL